MEASEKQQEVQVMHALHLPSTYTCSPVKHKKLRLFCRLTKLLRSNLYLWVLFPILQKKFGLSNKWAHWGKKRWLWCLSCWPMKYNSFFHAKIICKSISPKCFVKLSSALRKWMHLMPVILSHIVNNCVAINETIAMTEAQTDKERGDDITSIHD